MDVLQPPSAAGLPLGYQRSFCLEATANGSRMYGPADDQSADSGDKAGDLISMEPGAERRSDAMIV